VRSVMRRNRRRERRNNRPTDVYRLLNKNLGRNWLSFLLSGLVFIPYLFFSYYEITIIRGFITIFMGLIFIQSIRAIIKLRQLKKMLLSNPHSVTSKQIIDAPNLRTLFWFS